MSSNNVYDTIVSVQEKLYDDFLVQNSHLDFYRRFLEDYGLLGKSLFLDLINRAAQTHPLRFLRLKSVYRILLNEGYFPQSMECLYHVESFDNNLTFFKKDPIAEMEYINELKDKIEGGDPILEGLTKVLLEDNLELLQNITRRKGFKMDRGFWDYPLLYANMKPTILSLCLFFGCTRCTGYLMERTLSFNETDLRCFIIGFGRRALQRCGILYLTDEYNSRIMRDAVIHRRMWYIEKYLHSNESIDRDIINEASTSRILLPRRFFIDDSGPLFWLIKMYKLQTIGVFFQQSFVDNTQSKYPSYDNLSDLQSFIYDYQDEFEMDFFVDFINKFGPSSVDLITTIFDQCSNVRPYRVDAVSRIFAKLLCAGKLRIREKLSTQMNLGLMRQGVNLPYEVSDEDIISLLNEKPTTLECSRIGWFPEYGLALYNDDQNGLLELIDKPDWNINEVLYFKMVELTGSFSQPSLLDAAAMLGSSKCFFLVSLNSGRPGEDGLTYGIMGGNYSIVNEYINEYPFYDIQQQWLTTAIIYRRLPILEWLMEFDLAFQKWWQRQVYWPEHLTYLPVSLMFNFSLCPPVYLANYEALEKYIRPSIIDLLNTLMTKEFGESLI